MDDTKINRIEVISDDPDAMVSALRGMAAKGVRTLFRCDEGHFIVRNVFIDDGSDSVCYTCVRPATLVTDPALIAAFALGGLEAVRALGEPE